MSDNTEDKQVHDEVEREPKPLPGQPQEPTAPAPAGDPSKATPANGGWSSQDVPVPAN